MRPKPIPGLNALVAIAVLALPLAALCDDAHAQEPRVDVLMPCAVAYECVQDVMFVNATLSWKFSFDPRRAGIYDIVQWTVTRPGKRPRRFVAQLASREYGERIIRYYRIYEHVRVRNWKWVWLRHKTEWREHEWGSEQHDMANAALGRLFSLSMELRHGAVPASLTF